MSYTLVVGKSAQHKDNPAIVGQIQLDELTTISRLLKRQDTAFLHKISTFFDDQHFTLPEIQQAQKQLLPLLTVDLSAAELAMLHKLLAVLSYATDKQQPLFGIAN